MPICAQVAPASAAQRTLAWSIVDTPNNAPGGIITAGPSDNSSGINAVVLGPDNRTFYAADTANARLYKSTDAGVTWSPNVVDRLVAAGAQLPVWNLAVSPDDSSFVLAVTGPAPSGPRQVFYSGDGGSNWENTRFPLPAVGEYISCMDVSKIYGSNRIRDIAVGTRTGAGTGRVFIVQFNSAAMGTWTAQGSPVSPPCNITSLRFSPNYSSDSTIAAIAATPVMTFFTLGRHDTNSNLTIWSDPIYGPGYPVELRITSPVRKVVVSANLIKSDLKIPGDFLGTGPETLGCFASLQADNTTVVLYINVAGLGNKFLDITPPMTSPPAGRISSISYTGTEATGILLAGEARTIPSRGLVNVWQSSNAQSATPGAAVWTKSDEYKSPSGGGNSGGANAILIWSGDGTMSFCATSSENAVLGGTGLTPGQWPASQLASQLFDESALSVSTDAGNTWNQIGLINTRIDWLSDVAAVELPADMVAANVSNVLYLASLNENTSVTYNVTYNFDSVWRSTSDPPGQSWQRILLRNTSNTGTILRINPRTGQPQASGQVLVFADLGTDNITYSADQGQMWQNVQAGVAVNDISLLSDDRMYILEDMYVRQVTRNDSGWTLGQKLNISLPGRSHTICTPLKQAGAAEVVIVGSDFEDSSVAWADFTAIIPKFTEIKHLPPSARGDVHIVADGHFEQNSLIYVGLHNNQLPSTEGMIYRWQIGKSTSWDELDPTDRAFFGLAALNDILYGAWAFNRTTHQESGGIDRTLYLRVAVPPPPEWDDLTAGLPQAGEPGYPVQFTREPSSLKISSNSYNILWAIDDRPYNYNGNIGRLWMYIDSVARLGPWPTSPPTGGFIGADPSSGRGQQIDFKWRPLTDVFGYDLLIAKDVNFTLLLTQVLNLTPVDDYTGAWIVIPADQQQPSAWISPGVLETGRPYYWRVRASRALGGEIIHSPWSPVMLFTIKPGFVVKTDYPGPTLLTPLDGPCGQCRSPISFSWTPIKNAAKYEFVLASDPELKNVVTKTTTSSTAFEYKDKLEISKPYYWQVKAIAPVVSDGSPVGSFALTNTAPVTPPKAVAQQRTVPVQSPSDFWIWIIIVIALLLLMLINLYAFISRRRD